MKDPEDITGGTVVRNAGETGSVASAIEGAVGIDANQLTSCSIVFKCNIAFTKNKTSSVWLNSVQCASQVSFPFQ